MGAAPQTPRPGGPAQHRSSLWRPESLGWLLLALGLAGVVAGIIVLAWPGISLATLAVVTGIFLLVDGLLELGTVVGDSGDKRGTRALLGALSVIAGLFLIRHPVAGIVAVALLLGIWLVVLGVVRVVETLSRSERRRAWEMAIGTLEVIVGVVIVADTGIGVATLALIVGIAFIVRGVVMAGLGWALRSAERGG